MRFSSVRNTIRVFAITLAASLSLPVVAHAQQNDPNSLVERENQQTQDQQTKQNQLEGGGQQQAPKADPKEEAAYKAFFEASSDDLRIQLGNDFLQKYPGSRYTESVYVGLAQSYYAKQDWNNLYAISDKSLAINPDDVDILTLVGWVIPHVTSSGTADGDKQLAKAEDYEKRAIKDIPTLPKPATMTDQQFATLKAEKMSEAHSGLGLVYFRRQDFDDAVKELQQATQDNPTPDATDFYVLGASFQNSGHYQEAADAFTRCSQIMGSLQDTCKQNADKAKQLAAQNTPKK